MPIESTTVHEKHAYLHVYKRISWSAIFIGALVALGLGFLLNLFGVAIGLSATNLSETGQEGLAIGGLLGILVGVIASMLAAGYAAGYLGRFYCPQRNLGILYGFSTWTLSLILGALIALPLSNLANSSYSYSKTPQVSLETKSPNSTGNLVSVENKSTSTATGQQKVDIKAKPQALAWGGIGLFLMFFIGAFAACLGGHWGMSCRRED